MQKLIIFDMDGVIVQTHATSASVMKTVAHDLLGLDVTKTDVQNFYGVSDNDFYVDLISRNNLDISLNAVLAAQFARYNEKLQTEVQVTKDVLEIIAWLSEKHLVAICSGSTRDQVNIVIERFNLAAKITVSVSCDDVKTGKPDPEGYLHILNTLKVDSDNAVAIEDSPVGIESALRAGLRTVGFDNGLQQDISAANYQISSMVELRKIVDEL